MDKTFGWQGGAAYIIFWVGLSIADIGKISEPYVYSWAFPFLTLLFLLPAFLFGLIAGGGEG